MKRACILLLLLWVSPVVAKEETAASLYGKAVKHYQTGDYEASIRDASRAIAIEPSRSKPFLLRGHSYWRCGRLEAAAQDFEWAIQRRKDSAAPALFSYLVRAEAGLAEPQELGDLAEKYDDPVFKMMMGRIDSAAYLYDVSMWETSIPLRRPALRQAKFFVGHYYKLLGRDHIAENFLSQVQGKETEFLWAVTGR